MEKKKLGFRNILIVAVIAAVVAALVAAWKASNPIEDPWKLPTPKVNPQEPSEAATPASVSQIRDLAADN